MPHVCKQFLERRQLPHPTILAPILAVTMPAWETENC